VGKVTSATKSNALNYGMVFWDKLFAERTRLFPDINTDQYHVDALSMYMIQRPADFDVVVASNLFGDILTDLGSVLQGGIGFAAGGNINPDRVFPSMFEPVHGSAPDIAWKGLANPIAMIWTVKMMLDFLGHVKLGSTLFAAIEQVVLERRGELTADMGGSGTSSHTTDLILEALE
jgi:tartrate dehydrogenase/decarboxylase/D-malate dehydrogenase